jgi:hypothetical protein
MLLIANRTALIRSVLKSSIIIRYSISIVCNSVTVICTPVNAFNSHEYVSNLVTLSTLNQVADILLQVPKVRSQLLARTLI